MIIKVFANTWLYVIKMIAEKMWFESRFVNFVKEKAIGEPESANEANDKNNEIWNGTNEKVWGC